MKKKLFFTTAILIIAATGCEDDENYVSGKVETQAPTDITMQSAVLNGTIEVSEGNGNAITLRGFVFGTSPDNLSNEVVNTQGGGGAFSCTANGLLPKTKYYVKAYAGFGIELENYNSKVLKNISEHKVVFGKVEEFTTAEGQIPPIVTTQAADNIKNDVATLHGSIILSGYPVYTERGFAYGTSINPTIDSATKRTVTGTDSGSFNVVVTGLSIGTTYYARAYAISSTGATYGEQITFTTTSTGMPSVSSTTISNLTHASVTFESTITSSGTPVYTERGFVFSKNMGPTVDISTKLAYSGSPASDTFTVNTQDILTPNTLYYVRAYVINALGTVYGIERSFTTDLLSAPAVATMPANPISHTSVTLNGRITDPGNPNYTERGFVYSKEDTVPTISPVTECPVAAGTFTYDLIGLTHSTKYYYRAFAINSIDTVYASVLTFTTLTPSLPIVNTTDATNVTTTSATLNGSINPMGINPMGDPPYTEKGFVYGTSPTPTVDNATKGTVGTVIIGPFDLSVTGLTPATLYHVRAYATNLAGTEYGEEIIFNTP
ncbi:hypothetical protein FACS1894195_4060 [Bacteroidia bacterium]|nr:hypothetical protein FACS1894195_4060 [Bacteroidia bacterium]